MYKRTLSTLVQGKHITDIRQKILEKYESLGIVHDSSDEYFENLSPSASRYRRRRKGRYLSGKGRSSYTHAPTLISSLEEDAEQPGPSGAKPSSGASLGVCAKCKPILPHYTSTFKGLIHQGSELKGRKRLNPHPKCPNTIHYRDLKRQNDWIRENLFDPMGNYLFYSPCVRASLGVSRQRLGQRNIKRKMSKEPLRTTTKTEVEEARVSEYVVMPASLEIAFKEWWLSLQSSHTVMIRYPHAQHGNAGRKSNTSKS